MSKNKKRLLKENADLKGRTENAEQMLSDIVAGKADALLIPGTAGAQLFTLKDNDQSYRNLIENMGEGALTLTPEGLVLYSNRRFAEMLGTSLEKVIGSQIQNWFEEESQKKLETLFKNKELNRQSDEMSLCSDDGKLVPVYLSLIRMSLDGVSDSFNIVITDLTKQKRNEAILAEERLAREILEQADDVIVICDGNGRIIRASRKAQEFSSKDLAGQLFENVFPLRLLDSSPISSVGFLDMNLRQLVEATLEYEEQRFNFLVSIGHLTGAQNEILGCLVTMTDITERKAHELEVIRNQKQLSEALTIARIGYWEYETGSDEFIFNDQYYTLHRINAEEAGGYRMTSSDFVSRFVHPGSKDDIARQVQMALDSNDPDYSARSESRILTGKGETIWVEVGLKIHKDLKDGTIHLIGINQDITDRKKAELKLLESERLFTDLLENIELVSIMRDTRGRITYSNEYLLRLTGWLLEEIIGQNWVEIFLPPENKKHEKGFFKELLMNNPETLHSENEILTRSKEHRLIRWNNTVLRSGEGEIIGTASIGEDITEKRKTEARIIYLNRVYALLSGINTLIVRARDRTELCMEACRIAVSDGGFRMAMICITDESTNKLIPVSSAGGDLELLADLEKLLSSDNNESHTMIAEVISAKRVIISNDLSNDPNVHLGNKYGEHGIRSMIVMPLIVSGRALGTFALFARETDFFHKEELRLLTELAGDISFALDHIEKKMRLDFLAYYDELTGLANRTLFLDRVTQYIHSAVTDGHRLAVYQFDLERFKNINDSLGWKIGDELLNQVAEWLKLHLGDENLLARIDTDNFAIVIPEVKRKSDTIEYIEKLFDGFSQHLFHLNDSEFRINAKVGIALFPEDGSESDILLRNAEAALKRAKSGNDRYLFHTRNMTESVYSKLTMENQLRQAIENEEFVLYYQPKVNLKSNLVSSAEALIRWNKPGTGLIPPNEFIPLLEETGLIHRAGRWALRKAVEDYLKWREAGLNPVRIAVNVSALQLRNPGFIDEIKEVIALDSHAAEGLELEITEGLIMEEIKHSMSMLQTFRDIGVTIAIDDFGTGFSSLSYLTRLPVDTLKIDISFIKEMTVSPDGLALVSTIISLAHSMNLKVVAEGVETEQQSHLLHLLRCEEMQGFLFSKPVPEDIFQVKFLTSAVSDGVDSGEIRILTNR